MASLSTNKSPIVYFAEESFFNKFDLGHFVSQGAVFYAYCFHQVPVSRCPLCCNTADNPDVGIEGNLLLKQGRHSFVIIGHLTNSPNKADKIQK